MSKIHPLIVQIKINIIFKALENKLTLIIVKQMQIKTVKNHFSPLN